MICNCNNYCLRGDIIIRGDFLLIRTDKLFALHREEIRKMYTKKANCYHTCNNQYLYIKTNHEEIGIYIKDKTYEELLLHILNLLYPNKENSFVTDPFYLKDYKGFFENDIN